MGIDPGVIAKLKEQHGKIFIVTASYADEEVQVACKLPKGEAIKRFALAAKAGNEIEAQDGFFADLVVYPDPVKLADDMYPLVPQIVAVMVETLGIGKKATAKKA